MSALLSSMACGIIGLLLGAALQRWGDSVKASDHLSASKPRHEMDAAELSDSEFAALRSLWDRTTP